MKEKYEKIFDKIIDVTNNTFNFIRSNSDVIIPLIPVIAVGLNGMFKVVNSKIISKRSNKDVRFKQTNMYDRSLGYYIRLKKPLNNKELMEISNRRINGESLIDILQSMNLIKWIRIKNMDFNRIKIKGGFVMIVDLFKKTWPILVTVAYHATQKIKEEQMMNELREYISKTVSNDVTKNLSKKLSRKHWYF